MAAPVRRPARGQRGSTSQRTAADGGDAACITTSGIPQFFLGTGNPSWLARAGVPLFVSDSRLRRYRHFPAAVAPWACDSGGFTQLQRYGRWTVTPEEYVARLCRYRDEIGQLLWAAPQDMMAEPQIIHGGWHGGQFFAGTRQWLDPDHRLSDDELVAEHQRRTVANLLDLRALARDLLIIPVVQGFTVAQYVRCGVMYAEAGIDLTREPLIGVGSVCRRQSSAEIHQVFRAIRDELGVRRLHGFRCESGRSAPLRASVGVGGQPGVVLGHATPWSSGLRHRAPARRSQLRELPARGAGLARRASSGPGLVEPATRPVGRRGRGRLQPQHVLRAHPAGWYLPSPHPLVTRADRRGDAACITMALASRRGWAPAANPQDGGVA